ncbi:zinc-ribbon domain-containing protein [Acetanaerobacterium elongatum]
MIYFAQAAEKKNNPEMPKLCPSCGANVVAGASFCRKCGAKQ